MMKQFNAPNAGPAGNFTGIAMPLLFSYGTLQQEAVQMSTFGRLLKGQPDELIGFEQTVLRIEDAEFVAKSGKANHAIVRFNGRQDSRVAGMAFEVSDCELGRADEYEPAGYTRVSALLASGRQAWVYCENRSWMPPAAMIERLVPPVSDSDVRALGELLVDGVDSGAAISFLAPLTLERAEQWWRRTLAAADSRAVVLVARDADGIVGTVQMHPAWAPNQPHRADVAKLIVDRRARGQGVGQKLMDAIEAAARQAGFTLLTLDARQGGAAVRLYRRIGWTEVGVIPRYALDPDGKTPHGTVIFYKDLAS